MDTLGKFFAQKARESVTQARIAAAAQQARQAVAQAAARPAPAPPRQLMQQVGTAAPVARYAAPGPTSGPFAPVQGPPAPNIPQYWEPSAPINPVRPVRTDWWMGPPSGSIPMPEIPFPDFAMPSPTDPGPVVEWEDGSSSALPPAVGPAAPGWETVPTPRPSSLNRMMPGVNTEFMNYLFERMSRGQRQRSPGWPWF
jgi:hypothetical protein